MGDGAAVVRRLLNQGGLRRAIKRLSWIEQYETFGPLIGPKEPHQPPDPRWPETQKEAPHPEG